MERQIDSRTLIFMGISGCGKKTHITRLMEAYSNAGYRAKYFESGRELRKMAEHDPKIKHLIDNGYCVSDSIIEGMVECFLLKREKRDVSIFDGFPRTHAQAVCLDAMLKERNSIFPVIVVVLNISEKCALERMLRRKEVEQRVDDNEDAIKNRFKWFEEKTLPVIEHYKKDPSYTVIEIDGDRSIQDVFSEIVSRIANAL